MISTRNIRRLLTIVVLGGLALTDARTRPIGKIAKLRGEITPQNSVFVFDLHGVILQFSFGKVPVRYGISILGKIIKYGLGGYHGQGIEGALLSENSCDQSQTLELINPHRPVPATIELLKKLQAKGFETFGCSNIGERSFQHMQAQYPELKLLTACRTCNDANGHIRKNNAEAYRETIQMIAQQLGKEHMSQIKYIIFIDDTAANLQLAEQTDARFYGLLFKNNRKLSKLLHLLGIKLY